MICQGGGKPKNCYLASHNETKALHGLRCLFKILLTIVQWREACASGSSIYCFFQIIFLSQQYLSMKMLWYLGFENKRFDKKKTKSDYFFNLSKDLFWFVPGWIANRWSQVLDYFSHQTSAWERSPRGQCNCQEGASRPASLSSLELFQWCTWLEFCRHTYWT